VSEECNDGDDLCTDDVCTDNQCVHKYTGAEGCCKADSDCKSPDLCKAGICSVASFTCVFQPIEGCCHNDAECDDGDDSCTSDTCAENKCSYEFIQAEGCCQKLVWAKDFNDGTEQGFTFAGGMDVPGLFSAKWNVTGECGTHSDPAALYYGSPTSLMGASCIYTLDLGIPLPFPNSGTATSEQFELPDGANWTLTFWVMADISDAADADELKLELLSGGSTDEIWSKAELPFGAIGSSWNEVSLDVTAYAGKKVALRFLFDSLGGQPTSGVGVLVDDISLNADCNP